MTAAQTKNFFDLSAKNIDGQEISFSDYKGKVVLVANVASKCGFTSQYDGLESLYKKYRERGFVVLGFPSNDFMGQEPGTDQEIKQFCKLTYDVEFPMFTKGPVTGDNKQPVFKFLTEEANPELTGKVWWNFEKFLIDRNGKLVDRWKSITKPESEKITSKIEELLEQK